MASRRSSEDGPVLQGKARSKEACQAGLNEVDRNSTTVKFYDDERVVAEYDASRFSSPGGQSLSGLQLEAVARALPDSNLAGVTAIDVGAGTGRFTRFLQSQGIHVTAVDTSAGMLRRCLEVCPAAMAVRGDAMRLPFPDRMFDMGISVWVYNHLYSYREAIRELCRVCRHSVVLALPNRRSAYILPHLWRQLARHPLPKLEYTVRPYPGLQAPPSLYFSSGELREILAEAEFETTAVVGALMLPMIPNILARMYPPLDRLVSRFLGGAGSFLVIAAKRRDSR